MEEKRNNEVESLAAFLHSGSDEPAEVPVETVKEFVPAEKKTVSTKPSDAGTSLNDILFSIDKKKQQAAAAIAEEPDDDSPVVYDEDDELPDYSEYEDFENDNGHYDDAATQMMNALNVPVKKITAKKIEDEEEEETEEEKEERRQLRDMKIRYEKQRQHIRTFACILIGAILCAGILAVSAYFSKYIVTYALDLTGIVTNDFRIDVIIPEDADVETIGAILGENNIISSPKFFTFFANLTEKEDKPYKFNAGTYTMSSTMSYMTILSTLQADNYEEKIVSIRIVEGMTAREIGELLEENCVCFAEDFEKYYKNIQNNYDFERRLSESPYKYNQLEGYLFPDTYEFYVVQAMEDKSLHGKNSEEALAMYENSAENAEEAAKKMYKNFNDKMNRIMYKTMGEMNLTLDEVITLASMVQKEAASVEDMYYVASVFLNRIRNSESYPQLQSDVTVLYVENDIKPYLNNATRYNAIAKAYNTYECEGIPAGPICNPGLDAIDAVLNAAETNYFYFCANEETGEVFYAETQEQHEENLVLAGLTEE